jgi:hypothetical protein
MKRKEKARRWERRANRKTSCISKNNPDLQNRQSPWANIPAYDPLADIVQRSQADAERLDATCADDVAWFDANPRRRFQIRNATPHELDTGLACSWMLVARYSTGRMRLPAPFPALAAHDALEHDTEEKARELFGWLTAHFTEQNAHPFLFGVIKEIRGARYD